MKLIGLFFWLNCAESADQPADRLLNRVRKDIAIEDYPFSGKVKQLFKNFRKISANSTFFEKMKLSLKTNLFKIIILSTIMKKMNRNGFKLWTGLSLISYQPVFFLFFVETGYLETSF